MTPLQALQSIASRRLSSASGDLAKVKLLPPSGTPATPDLPADPLITELLATASGFHLAEWEVTFHDSGSGQYTPGMAKTEACVLCDGCGNSWNADIHPQTGHWGPIYFNCHDPPVVVLQSPDLAQFILDVAANFEIGDESGPLDNVRSTSALRIWEQGGLEIPAAAASNSIDPLVQQAAKLAGVKGFVVDMRIARPGDGFRWDIDGRMMELHRVGASAIWGLRE